MPQKVTLMKQIMKRIGLADKKRMQRRQHILQTFYCIKGLREFTLTELYAEPKADRSISFRVPACLAAQIDEQAITNGINRSEVIITALLASLDNLFIAERLDKLMNERAEFNLFDGLSEQPAPAEYANYADLVLSSTTLPHDGFYRIATTVFASMLEVCIKNNSRSNISLMELDEADLPLSLPPGIFQNLRDNLRFFVNGGEVQ